jgi:conjugative relaxase-like TrwC/TraI family protein
VLSVARLGARLGADYYLSRVAAGPDGYYLGRGEAPGRWVGGGTTDLGLSGTVEGDDFRAVLAGVHPRTGEPLAAANRTRPGSDLCFSPPKSVSVLFGLGDADTAATVIRCHEEAVDAALDWLERHAAVTRVGHNGVESMATTGFVAAAFRHRTSRAGDPQLHTHVVVANAVLGVDGKWRTIDGRALYDHALTAGHLYDAHLRHAMSRELGVAHTEVVKGTAEVVGVPPEVLREFSTRREEIEERLALRGESSARAAEVACLDTRRPKGPTADAIALAAGWRERAEALGFDAEAFTEVFGRVTVEELRAERWEKVAAALSSPEGLTAHVSSFARGDVLRAICAVLPDGAPVTVIEALADDYLGRAEVVALPHRDNGPVAAAGPRAPRFSTADMLEVERRALASALGRRGEGAGTVAEEVLADVLAGRPGLSAEQAAMVRVLTASGNGVDAVIAPAGAGKTFTLDACREAWQSAGREVLGCALAARAAAELQDGSGIPSSTIAALLRELDRPESEGLPRGAVLVVDEAAMAGTRQARLLDYAAAADAKVVLVGDPRQIPAVEAGGLLGGLADRMGAVRLTENFRQREAWERAALVDFRDGDLDRALAAYDANGRVVRGDSAAEVREAMAADWWAATLSGDSALMLAVRRSDVDDLNARARVRVAGTGRLHGPELVVGERPYQAGDRVVTLRNDRHIGVLNGTRGTVVGVEVEGRELAVRTDAGALVSLPSRYLDAGHVAHGYAVTAHKAQGANVDRAMLLGTDDLYRELGYAGLSRGRVSNHLYVVGGEGLDPDLHHGVEPPEEPDDRVFRMLHRERADSLALDVGRPGPAARLVALHAERRQLAPVLHGAPPDTTADRRALAEVRREVVQRLARAEAEAAGRSRWRRPTVEQSIAAARAAGFRSTLDNLEDELAALAVREEARDRWLHAHGHEAARAADIDSVLPHVLAERVAEVERRCPRYLHDALGRPPEDEAGRAWWRRGVEVIEDYRAREGITTEFDALGAEPPSGDACREWHLVSTELAHVKAEIVQEATPPTGPELNEDFGIGL